MASSAILTVLSVIFSLAVTILAFIFIVPDKKRARLNKFGKFLHDVCNFRFLVIEKILQFFYILATAYTIIGGFFTLFTFEQRFSYYSYSYSKTTWVGYWGFVMMILGPIAVRIAYEILMLAIIAIKNIIQINNKLKNQNDDSEHTDLFSVANFREYAPVREQTQQNQVENVQFQQNCSQQAFEPVVTVDRTQTPKFCVRCGSPLSEDGTCPNCQ